MQKYKNIQRKRIISLRLKNYLYLLVRVVGQLVSQLDELFLFAQLSFFGHVFLNDFCQDQFYVDNFVIGQSDQYLHKVLLENLFVFRISHQALAHYQESVLSKYLRLSLGEFHWCSKRLYTFEQSNHQPFFPSEFLIKCTDLFASFFPDNWDIVRTEFEKNGKHVEEDRFRFVYF